MNIVFHETAERFYADRIATNHATSSQTGTTNHFDVKLQVQAQNNESKEDALKRAALEQLGLELVSSRESMKMLDVEKAKD